TGEPRTPPMPHGQSVLHACFSPDGRLILTSCSDATARIWDAKTGEPLIVPLKHEHAVRYAEFSADSLRVITATEDGAWSWNIPSDHRPPEEIVLQANVLTGRRIDSSGTLTPLTQDEIYSAWANLKSRGSSPPGSAVQSPQGTLQPVELTASDGAGA